MKQAPSFKMFNLRITSVAILSALLGLGICESSANEQGIITIENPQVRSTAPGQKVTGAFMTLKNTSDADINLTAASSDMAGMTEIHESSMKDGMMEMHEVDKIIIPANGSAELKPGGFHIMLMGLNKQLTKGETASITLTFSDDTEQTIEAVVVDVAE